MHQGKFLFAQIMEHLPRHEFDACVSRYKGEHYSKRFSSRDQFLAMAFGQLAYRDSLRDVVTCLASHRAKLYHLGFQNAPAKSTLASANEKRDWRIYRDLASILIEKARTLYIDEPALAEDLTSACYAIDSTSIELCLSLFPWAPFVSTKGAVKVHTVMDLRGSIPTFFNMTSGKVNDVHFLDLLTFEAKAFYVMDRGYIDFGRLYTMHTKDAFFVTRAKQGMRFERRYSAQVNRNRGIICDQTIVLRGTRTATAYPHPLRRIKYYDKDTDHTYVFLTNNTDVSASSIALLYKHRWQIELFFKWIKQHLKIKSFWGRSENAVKTQICIALCAYLMVAVLKKQLRLEQTLYEILQILSVSLFDKSGLATLFSGTETTASPVDSEYTLNLLDF